MPAYVNDGSADEPKLLAYLNLANLDDLRPGSLWPNLPGGLARDARLAAAGRHPSPSLRLGPRQSPRRG